MFDRSLLPPPGERRLAVRVTADALRQIRGGHPWLFENAITSLNRDDAAPGDLAVIFDDDRKFAAIGLYDPTSPICVRVLHRGKPVTLDAAWFAAALDNAIARRQSLIDDPTTSAYRLVHGENDGWPGLIVDRYEGYLVVKLYSAAWLVHLPMVTDLLVERCNPDAVIVRLSREVARGTTYGLTDGLALHGDAPTEPIVFLENGHRFEADVCRGQKTGHFLDQRDNRRLTGEASAGRRVLDVFASTGGFSVYAAAAGAGSVHVTDLNPHAIDTARRNLARNDIESSRQRFTIGDAFEVMEAMIRAGERYDVVVVDPPSFARRAVETSRALAAYARLTGLALGLTAPGALLVQSSCSSRVGGDEFYDTVNHAAERVGRPLKEIRRTGHAIDHPVGFSFGAYLKTVYATV